MEKSINQISLRNGFFFLLPEDDEFAVVAFFTYHNTLFPACSRPRPEINRFEILQNKF